MTSEEHPENGTTTYTYDARGHVIKKVTPIATLTTTYDAAERVTTVSQTGVGELQKFTYDGAGALNGRMSTATRHNRHAGASLVTVKETFVYGGGGGRLSAKTTAISDGPSFTENYTYNELAALETVVYPTCTGCSAFSPPSRTVTNVYTAGLLTEVTGYTNAIRYHPNGLVATLRHRNANGTDGPLFTQTIDASTRMARPSSTSVTEYCDGFEIEVQPPPQKTVTAGAPANISVAAPGATSYEWYILGSTEKLPNENGPMLNYVVHTTTSFWARVSNGTCTVDSSVSTVNAQICVAPDSAITAPASVGPAAQATATAAGVGAYSWTIENGTIVSGQNARTVTFRASCSGAVTLRVRVVANCGQDVTGAANIPVSVPVVSVSASPASIAQGSSSTLTVNVTGGPWTVIWSDGYVQTGVTTSASRPPSTPTQTTAYSVTHLNGCSGAYGSATIMVVPPPPVGVVAARSGNGIQLTWSTPPGANVDFFLIDRCASSCVGSDVGWAAIGSAPASPFFDTNVVASRAYVYRVRAAGAGTPSPPSAADFATSFVFTNDPIVPGVTMLKVVHLADLRAAVNALRTAAGLSQTTFRMRCSPASPSGRCTLPSCAGRSMPRVRSSAFQPSRSIRRLLPEHRSAQSTSISFVEVCSESPLGLALGRRCIRLGWRCRRVCTDA